MEKPDGLEDVIFKDKTMVSCDHIGCDFYGDMQWCYKGRERRCGMYREWEQKKFGTRE